ncbi:MAG: SHOCT domain-containing protein [Actinobacteria bacterium]|nr:SHOCT domain-containing protein [Actinomycetota bacterium]
MHGNWNNDMHDGFGWGWIPMAMMMLLVWGSVVWLGVALLRRAGTHEHPAATGPAAPPAPNPQQILAERLARGEIEPDDYRTRLETLTAPRS